jgi:hypothetical protein
MELSKAYSELQLYQLEIDFIIRFKFDPVNSGSEEAQI